MQENYRKIVAVVVEKQEVNSFKIINHKG